jgi:hypothetical protein
MSVKQSRYKRIAVVEVRCWHGVRARTLGVEKNSLGFGRFCQRGFIDHFSKEKKKKKRKRKKKVLRLINGDLSSLLLFQKPL